jgi:hypothetical protein
VITAFDVIQWAAIFAGGYGGYALGSKHFGLFGGIGGGVVGLIAGYFLGRLPFLIAWRSLGIRHKSTEELKSIFQRDQFFIFHLALAELISRGVDVSGEKLRVLDLLLSAASDRRRFGWGSLQIAYPDLAATLRGFDAQNPSSNHLDIIRKLRREIEAVGPVTTGPS